MVLLLFAAFGILSHRLPVQHLACAHAIRVHASHMQRRLVLIDVLTCGGWYIGSCPVYLLGDELTDEI